jgi:hypothetical protein
MGSQFSQKFTSLYNKHNSPTIGFNAGCELEFRLPVPVS